MITIFISQIINKTGRRRNSFLVSKLLRDRWIEIYPEKRFCYPRRLCFELNSNADTGLSRRLIKKQKAITGRKI